LGLPRPAIERRVETALAAVGMTGRRDERVDALSGGEQARVAIAGALAMDPAHLVLDEPLAGIDDRARRRVVERLGDLAADGTGVVAVTHDLRDLWPLADRVVVLQDGRVALDAAPAEARGRLADLGVRPPADDGGGSC
ncbi:MAG: ABC transporter ATP-binding protein, partial [Halobacteriales archaeon]